MGGLPGIGLDLLTPRLGGAEPVEKMERPTVHRVELRVADDAFYPPVLRANEAIAEHAYRLWDESGRFDPVHVHDWVVAPPGMD
jgi:hypothetical protein